MKRLIPRIAARRTLGWGTIAGVGVILVIVTAIMISLVPPHKVTDVSWCLQADETTRVTGRLTRTLIGSSVADHLVQIKIYEAGQGDPPFKMALFAMTDAEGVFTVEFSPPAPTSGTLHLINTAYMYNLWLLGERWEIRDFFMGPPQSCQ